MSASSITAKTKHRDDWNKLAAAALKSDDLTKLNRITEDSITIEPLYLSEDHQEALPDHFSAKAERDWQITQMIEPCADAASLNRMILDELEGGAAGVLIPADQDLDFINASMDGVYLDAISLEFDAPFNPIKAQSQVIDLWQSKAISAEDASASIGFDIFTKAAYLGAAFDADQTAETIKTLIDASRPWGKMYVLMVGGAKWHRMGLTPAGQIAATLSEVIALCQIGQAAGIALDDLIQKTRFQLAFDADLYQGIAKARAFRLTLDQVLSAMEMTPDPSLARRLHAITAERMFSRIDTDTNILRNGTALLSASLSGFGIITALPHDWLTGSTEQGRRVARNMHHLLADEGHLNHIADPAQGSYFIDSLTSSLAQKAWDMMQEIEQSGGMASALSTGVIAAWAKDGHMARQTLINTGQNASLGTTLHPPQGVQMDIQPLKKDVMGMRGGDCRVTAPWEDLCRGFTGQKSKSYRCLLLDAGIVEGQSAAQMKRWFAASGLDTAEMKADDINQADQIITSAKPDILILGGALSGALLERGQDHQDHSIIIDMDAVYHEYAGDFYRIMASIADQLLDTNQGDAS